MGEGPQGQPGGPLSPLVELELFQVTFFQVDVNAVVFKRKKVTLFKKKRKKKVVYSDTSGVFSRGLIDSLPRYFFAISPMSTKKLSVRFHDHGFHGVYQCTV